jgi:hypothetical protein
LAYYLPFLWYFLKFGQVTSTSHRFLSSFGPPPREELLDSDYTFLIQRHWGRLSSLTFLAIIGQEYHSHVIAIRITYKLNSSLFHLFHWFYHTLLESCWWIHQNFIQELQLELSWTSSVSAQEQSASFASSWGPSPFPWCSFVSIWYSPWVRWSRCEFSSSSCSTKALSPCTRSSWPDIRPLLTQSLCFPCCLTLELIRWTFPHEKRFDFLYMIPSRLRQELSVNLM